MKLGHGSEIAFTLTHNGVTQYTLTLEGEPTMLITCDAADPERAIKLVTIGGDHFITTKGRFEMKEKLTEDSEGAPLGVETRVDSQSVYRYVLPRLPLLLGRLLRAAN